MRVSFISTEPSFVFQILQSSTFSMEYFSKRNSIKLKYQDASSVKYRDYVAYRIFPKEYFCCKKAYLHRTTELNGLL